MLNIYGMTRMQLLSVLFTLFVGNLVDNVYQQLLSLCGSLTLVGTLNFYPLASFQLWLTLNLASPCYFISVAIR